MIIKLELIGICVDYFKWQLLINTFLNLSLESLVIHHLRHGTPASMNANFYTAQISKFANVAFAGSRFQPHEPQNRKIGEFKMYRTLLLHATILVHAIFTRWASNFNPEGMTSRRAVNTRNKVVINPRQGSP